MLVRYLIASRVFAVLSSSQGYVTNSGVVNMSRVQIILSELGEMEDNIFKERQRRELYFREREKRNKRFRRGQHQRPKFIPGGQFAPHVRVKMEIQNQDHCICETFA